GDPSREGKWDHPWKGGYLDLRNGRGSKWLLSIGLGLLLGCAIGGVQMLTASDADFGEAMASVVASIALGVGLAVIARIAVVDLTASVLRKSQSPRNSEVFRYKRWTLITLVGLN